MIRNDESEQASRGRVLFMRYLYVILLRIGLRIVCSLSGRCIGSLGEDMMKHFIVECAQIKTVESCTVLDFQTV